MSDCIFCKIVNKEMDGDIVYESDHVLAFKDINPEAPVHILIIPKQHLESIMDITVEHKNLLFELIDVAQTLAKEYKIDQSGFRLVNNCGQEGGQTVGHLHIHLLGGRVLTWPPG